MTLAELGMWLSVSKADARARLDALAAELEEVDREGESAWVLAADLELFADPPPLHGVRLLGAGDPLLDGRDRASILRDPAARKDVWKAISNPGVVLEDGELVGTWRAKARRRRLDVSLTPLGGAHLPAAGARRARGRGARRSPRARRRRIRLDVWQRLAPGEHEDAAPLAEGGGLASRRP